MIYELVGLRATSHQSNECLPAIALSPSRATASRQRSLCNQPCTALVHRTARDMPKKKKGGKKGGKKKKGGR